MIQHAIFSLDLDPRWRTIANDDPDQFNFRDDLRDISATISSFATPLDTESIDIFTRHLVKSRLKA